MSTPNTPNHTQENLMVCGYPKTGRTWLRFMLACSLAEQYELGVSVTLSNAYSIVPNDAVEIMPGQPDFTYHNVIPKIEMSHRPYTSEVHDDSNLVFLTRDPRDIMVSHWLHDKNQVRLFSGDLHSYVREPSRGIAAFLSHLEGWAPKLSSTQVIAYEAMRENPFLTLGRVCTKFGLKISDTTLFHAVEKSSMAEMQQMELRDGIAGLSYDRTNPEARRVRRGKVGGFVDYLNSQDINYINSAIESSSRTAKNIIDLTGFEL